MKAGKQKYKTEIYYGWFLTAALWGIYFLSTTTFSYGCVGVILPQTVMEKGWSENVIAYSTSAQALTMAAASILAGTCFRIFGMKKTMLAGIIMEMLGFSVITFISLPEALYILLYGILGMSTVFGIVIAAPVLINNWFDRNKSMPMSIVLTAGAIGGFLMPGLLSYITGSFGIKSCGIVLVLLVAVCLLLIMFVIKEEPSEVGEIPDGIKWNQEHPKESAEEPLRDHGSVPEKTTSLFDILKMPLFYMMLILTFILRAAAIIMVSYAVVYSVQKGLPEGAGVALLSIYNISGFIGRTIMTLADRLHVKKSVMNAVLNLGLAAGEGLMAFSGSFSGMAAGAMLVGFSFGCMYCLFPVLVSVFFGKEHYADVYGILNMVSNAGSALAPFLVLFIQSQSGSYAPAFLFYGVLALFCMGISVILAKKEQVSDRKNL